MVTYSQLNEADFSGLRTAADDWAALPKSLSGAGGVSGEWDKVSKGLQNSDWSGAAARAAIPVMNTIATQISAAGDEAFDIGKLLGDAHHRLVTAQNSLKSVTEEINAPGGSFSVDEAGTITLRSPDEFQDNPEGLEFAEQTMGSYQRQIQSVLQDAADVDESLYWALNQDENGSGQGFNANAVAGISDAEKDLAQAKKDARTAADLAKRGTSLTDDQIKELNGLLSEHRGDPEFGAAFATDLGAQGTLELWAQVSDPFTRTMDDPKDITALQSDLSFTLADATRYHSPAMTQWENQIIAKGTENIAVPGPGMSMPLGFQVMSSLMHQGDYDGGFLQKYGTALLTADKHVQADPAGWNRFGAVSSLDPQGHGDPVSGFMDALGHNPQESLAFIDGKGNFSYLTSGRYWLDNSSGKTSLSHALMSATTGHDYDVPANIDTPQHSPAQAALMHEVVNYYAGDGSSDAQGPMAQSLGRAAAEYMPDFNRSLSGMDSGTMHQIFLGNGASANLGKITSTEFLYNVSNNPSGYAAVSLGQSRYSAGMINYHLTHSPVPGLPQQDTINEISRRGATIQEIVNQGRADGVVNGAAASDASYNKALGYGVEWTKATAGAASGFAADAITENPFVGPFVEKGVETGSGDVIDYLTAGLVRDTTDQANQNAKTIMDTTMNTYQNAVQSAVLAHNPTGVPRSQIDLGLSDGFSSGRDDGSTLYNDYIRKHGTG